MSIEAKDDPVNLFHDWLEEARAQEVNDPAAMCLATVDPDGRPSARMVLLKGADENGFVFFTNFESRKGTELLTSPHAALCFHWKSLRRQVRVEGAVEPVTDEEADAYFSSRPRQSQIGAWASAQSRPMESRYVMEKNIARYVAKFAIGAVPRPPQWSGFRVLPDAIEFWKDGAFRIHDRLLYRRIDDQWQTERLFP